MSPISLWFLPDFGIFQLLFLWIFFSTPHSCSFLYGIWMTWILDLLSLSQALRVCSCFSVCFLFVQIGSVLFVCVQVHWFFPAIFISAIKSSQWVFNLVILFFQCYHFYLIHCFASFLRCSIIHLFQECS